jgi:hypothetical protein
MDRPRAIHGHVRDDAAAHEIDDERCKARLHDVAAKHGDDRTSRARGGGDRTDDSTEVASDEDVRE